MARRVPGSKITGSGFKAATLSEAADAIDAYVKNVVDLTTNTTGAKAETAREGAWTAFGAALDAAEANDGSGYAGLVKAAITPLLSAKTNRKNRTFLAATDAQMPDLMERIGHAGRLRTAYALETRAQAATVLANRANLILANARSPSEQALAYSALEAPLNEQNVTLGRLRSTDPMVAAQAFAVAHHALVEAYGDPKANHAATASAAKAFADAAQKLGEALKKD